MKDITPLRAPFRRLGDALSQLIRPAIGFIHPDDVVKDPDLTWSEKKAILASWASDACAVENRSDLRWMLGSPEPVRLADVQDALERLERRRKTHLSCADPGEAPGMDFRLGASTGQGAACGPPT